MSGRFQTLTVASEGVEQDDNYQKMVADIEEQTQRSGWLFGRGAFDKADLQYLRDFNNSLRYKEVEIEDKEKALWERERARLDAEAAVAAAAAAAQQVAALTRRSSGGSGAHVAVLLRGPAGASPRPAPLVLPVKVKPVGSRTPRQQQQQSTSPSGEGPSCKRARTDSVADAPGIDAHASPLSTAAALRSVRSEPSPAGASPHTSLSAGTGGAAAVLRYAAVAPSPPGQQQPTKQDLDHDQQQQVTRARTQSAPEIPGSEARAGLLGGSAAGSGGRDGKRTSAPTDLANLLGGYGSGDDDDDDDAEKAEERSDGEDGGRGGSNGAVGAGRGGPSVGSKGVRGEVGSKLPPPVGLLSPEELLADPRVISEGLLATRPQPQNVQGGDTWNSEEPSGSGSDSEA